MGKFVATIDFQFVADNMSHAYDLAEVYADKLGIVTAVEELD
jgi:hypothetical protein